jgi:hypothetical protein
VLCFVSKTTFRVQRCVERAGKHSTVEGEAQEPLLLCPCTGASTFVSMLRPTARAAFLSHTPYSLVTTNARSTTFATCAAENSYRQETERHKEGSEYIALDVLRAVTYNDGRIGEGRGSISAWLSADESDFTNDRGELAALWHVIFNDTALGEEDLEDHEERVRHSARAPEFVCICAGVCPWPLAVCNTDPGWMQVLDVENKGYLEEDVFTRFMTTMGEKLSADEVNIAARNSRQSQI